MTVKNPKELFVMLLSDARQSTERSTKIYQEISQAAQDPDVKEALESRAWISEKDLGAIDRCFELIGEQPVKLSGRLQEVFVEPRRSRMAKAKRQARRSARKTRRAARGVARRTRRTGRRIARKTRRIARKGARRIRRTGRKVALAKRIIIRRGTGAGPGSMPGEETQS